MSTAPMKSIRLPPLPFRITGTTQFKDWKNWQRSFKSYAKSINLEQQCHDVQLCIFKSLVGPDALEIYNTFSLLDISDVESVLRKFDKYFEPKGNVTLERYKLYRLHQKSGQKFDDFLSDLTNQVENCQFKSLRDEIVLYKLVGGIDNDEIRNVLLADADLKYDKAVQICRASSAVHSMSRKENGCIGTVMKKKEELGKIQKVPFREVEESLLESARNDQGKSSEIRISGIRSLAIKKEHDHSPKDKTCAAEKSANGRSYKKPIKVETSIDSWKDSAVLKLPDSGNVEEEVLRNDVGRFDNSDWTGDNCYVYDPDHLRLEKSSALNLGSAVEKFLERIVVHKESKTSAQLAVENFLKKNLGIKEKDICTRPAESERVNELGLLNEHGGSDCDDYDWRDNALETVDIVPKSRPKKRTSQIRPKKQTSRMNCKPGETPEKHKNFPCDICGQVLASRKYVSIHKKTHVQEGKVTCHYCGSLYKLKRYLVKHIAKKHPGIIEWKDTRRTHTCEQCGYETKNMANMRRHKYQHTGERPFSCELCEYKCVVRRSLKAHMAKHTGEKPLLCSVCSKGFMEPNVLKKHMMTHLPLEEKVKQPEILEATCEVCGKNFSHKGALKVHSMRHTGEKPFACHICGFRTVTNKELTTHLTVHSEEKPFDCFTCGYSCKTKSALQKHMKIHSGEKSHACKVCGRKFSQSNHVKRHMMTHTGEKPYVCDICGHSWTTASNLKAHVKVHEKYSGDFCQYLPSNKQQKPVVIVVAADSNESGLYEEEYAAADAIMTWSEQVSAINSVDYHTQS